MFKLYGAVVDVVDEGQKMLPIGCTMPTKLQVHTRAEIPSTCGTTRTFLPTDAPVFLLAMVELAFLDVPCSAFMNERWRTSLAAAG